MQNYIDYMNAMNNQDVIEIYDMYENESRKFENCREALKEESENLRYIHKKLKRIYSNMDTTLYGGSTLEDIVDSFKDYYEELRNLDYEVRTERASVNDFLKNPFRMKTSRQNYSPTGEMLN